MLSISFNWFYYYVFSDLRNFVKSKVLLSVSAHRGLLRFLAMTCFVLDLRSFKNFVSLAFLQALQAGDCHVAPLLAMTFCL